MKNQKQTKKNNAAKNPARGKPADMSHRVLTMAEYLAMEKVAHAIETACRIRRKYAMAMKGATEVIERNLDKLRSIAWSEETGK